MIIEAMKQALMQLNRDDVYLGGRSKTRADAIPALRQAIEQAEKQEPVAWMTINEYGEEDDIHYENPEGHLLEGWTYKPLYTHPPSVQPKPEPLEYWNAVEGWVKIDEVREHFNSVGCGTIYKTAGEDRVPLYTTPPAAQRQWVGLTDEDIYKVIEENIPPQLNTLFDMAKWVGGVIEAKLKEKNT
jgi:hypothetical protein